MASPNTPKPVTARCGGPAQKSLHAFCDVIERDDGKWSIGLGDDAAGPFESRTFALEVANRDTGDPPDKRRRPRRANPRPLNNRLDRAAATNKYATAEIGSRDLFATGGDCYRTIGPNGLLIGKTRAQASGVRP